LLFDASELWGLIVKKLFGYAEQVYARCGRAFSIGVFLAVFVSTAQAADTIINDTQDETQVDVSAISFDGMELIEDARVGAAYINPNADFSVFQRVAILDPYVSFRRNWLRDQNRNRSRNLRASDAERIKADVAALFKEVFTARLEADDGFEVVDFGGDDVLLLRPAIINLDVAAPDTQTAGRSRTFTATAGAATLYIELFDSVTGDILGRAADNQRAGRGGGNVSWSNSVTNSAEARRIFGRWANILRDFLDSHYMSAKDADLAAVEAE
jgi:hypothetical protein